MKKINYCLIGVVVLMMVIWAFCYACTSGNDERVQDIHSDVSIYEKAGIGHNECLSVFFSKLQGLRSNKTRANGDGSEENGPGGDDDEFLSTEEEEAVVSTIVEMFENLAIDEEDKASMKTELEEIINNCNDEEIDPYTWSDEALDFVAQYIGILETNYSNVEAMIVAISALEGQVGDVLSEDECEKFKMSTSIMRHSLTYWEQNYELWFPQAETTRGWFNDCVQVANADGEAALCMLGLGQATKLGATAIASKGWGAISRIGAGVLRCASWQVQLGVIAGWAAISSIAEAMDRKCTDDIDNDGLEQEEDLKMEFCCSVMTQAMEEFVSEPEEEVLPDE